MSPIEVIKLSGTGIPLFFSPCTFRTYQNAKRFRSAESGLPSCHASSSFIYCLHVCLPLLPHCASGEENPVCLPGTLIGDKVSDCLFPAPAIQSITHSILHISNNILGCSWRRSLSPSEICRHAHTIPWPNRMGAPGNEDQRITNSDISVGKTVCNVDWSSLASMGGEHFLQK